MSVQSRRKTMDRAAADAVTIALLTSVHRKLEEAAAIARAANAGADNGNVEGAVRMVMDIEDPTHHANRMLNAALLITSGS
jgi:hypothetical protein